MFVACTDASFPSSFRLTTTLTGKQINMNMNLTNKSVTRKKNKTQKQRKFAAVPLTSIVPVRMSPMSRVAVPPPSQPTEIPESETRSEKTSLLAASCC